MKIFPYLSKLVVSTMDKESQNIFKETPQNIAHLSSLTEGKKEEVKELLKHEIIKFLKSS